MAKPLRYKKTAVSSYDGPARVRSQLKYRYTRVAATKKKPAHVVCICELSLPGVASFATEGKGATENDAWKEATRCMKAEVDRTAGLTW